MNYCSHCGTPLEWDFDAESLYCSNPECGADYVDEFGLADEDYYSDTDPGDEDDASNR